MLFKDILNRKADLLRTEIDKLFEQIIKTQTHPGDLLLVRINGFYNEDVFKWNNIEPQSPYMIGPNTDGFSENAHYKFINHYRNGALLDNYEEYIKDFDYTPERHNEIQKLNDNEEMYIQLEMLIYLKIWEADAFIKKLYQLARLANGEVYDWHFRIKDATDGEIKATGSRGEIIRDLTRDKFKNDFPIIYSTMKNGYVSQIRNAIAHSQYSLMSRHIQLYNNGGKYSPLKALDFEDWTDKFHDTILLHNELIGLMRRVDERYANVASRYDNKFEIRIKKIDPHSIEYRLLTYDPVWKRW